MSKIRNEHDLYTVLTDVVICANLQQYNQFVLKNSTIKFKF